MPIVAFLLGCGHLSRFSDLLAIASRPLNIGSTHVDGVVGKLPK